MRIWACLVAGVLILLCLNNIVLAQSDEALLATLSEENGWLISGTFVRRVDNKLVIKKQGIETTYVIDSAMLTTMQECNPEDNVSIYYVEKDGNKTVSTLINWNDLRSATMEGDV